MFAIFILTNGKWVQHGDLMSFASKADCSFAKIELDYLKNVMGVTAKAFRKV
jgi:hypothetical protein